MKLFFIIIMSFVTGWVVHVFFYQDKPEKDMYSSKIECSNSNDSSNPKIIEKIVIKELIKFVPKTKIIYRTKEKKADSNSSQDLFLLALEKNEFDEAMNYYQDAEEKKHSLYQMALFGYFEKLEKKEPLQTIEQMQSFIEIEPESKLIVFQLAQFFKMKNKYQDALNLIIDFSYVASYEEKNSIYNKIKSISLEYIQKLNSTKSFQILIDFLINRIETAVLSDFYSFELSKVYLKLKKYTLAIELLQELINSDVYRERATEMLVYIQNKLEEQEEYPIQIPLIRKGLHFLVKASANNIPMLLLVDTGASVTTVDNNLIANFTIIKENARFHTAGGEVYNTIFQADSFELGSVFFENFTLSGTDFSGRDNDGLLGMNFLGKFKFKIDQQEAILYLGEKSQF